MRGAGINTRRVATSRVVLASNLAECHPRLRIYFRRDRLETLVAVGLLREYSPVFEIASPRDPPSKMRQAILLALLNYLLSVASENIVLILTDDQDLTLDGMTPMTHTQNLIGRHGATFANCFVASPICCPNRASILTGRYQHNHLTVNNTIAGGCSSAQWQQSREPTTFAALLQSLAGYKTFYAGKYLNEYGNNKVGGATHVPVGWDWWAGLLGNSKYYDYSLSINGSERMYDNGSADYLTDVISNLAVDFINVHADDRPFLMVLAPPAPHAPFTPADRHNHKYNGTTAKRTPNFNVPVNQDKHWLVRSNPAPLPDNVLPKLDDIFSKRWETLLAVDELVATVHKSLKKRKLLHNTYFIYTSDNGYHIGQFSMPMDKRQPYETDIRVPLLISGPGIAPATISAPVSSVDIFATLLDIAGVEYASDGTTLLKRSNNLSEDRTLLIEYRGERSKHKPSTGCPSDRDPNVTLCMREMACKCQDAANNTFSCIRRVSSNFNNIFCVFEDDQEFVEAYDLNVDEYQMTNIGYTMKKEWRHRFRKRLKRMTACRGADCILAELRAAKTDHEATKSDYQKESQMASGCGFCLLLEHLMVSIFIPLAISTRQLL